jgi:hypothetical protein
MAKLRADGLQITKQRLKIKRRNNFTCNLNYWTVHSHESLLTFAVLAKFRTPVYNSENGWSLISR